MVAKADIALLFLAVGMETVLLVLLLRRQIYSRFPCFFFYFIASIIMGLIRASVSSNYQLYFHVFWITYPIYHLWIVLVLYEVFRQVFDDYYAVLPLFRWLFPSVAVLVIGLSVLYDLLHPSVQANRLISALLMLGFAVNLMQSGLFLLFFFLVRHYRLWWRAYPYAIVLGFGVAAIGAWVPYWLRYDFGKNFNTIVKYTPPMAYIVAVIFWLDVFRRPEPDMRIKLSFHPAEALPVVRRTMEALKRIREGLK